MPSTFIPKGLLAFLINLVIFRNPANLLKLSHNPEDIKFYIYTDRSNPYNYQEIRFRDLNSLSQSGFVPNIYTLLFVHGFSENSFSNISGGLLVAAYLKSGIPGNFILMDWSKLSDVMNDNFLTSPITYPQAVANVKVAGKRLAEFLLWLDTERQVSPDLLHVTGVSLGAHVAGQAGNIFCCQKKGIKVNRISGFDPAFPLTSPPIQLTHTLTKLDAEFVDIVHSNVGIFGEIIKPGDVDIFGSQNKQRSIQPGCNIDEGPNQFIVCNHVFALRVFAASLLQPLLACECLNHFLPKGRKGCKEAMLVGYPISERARGWYCIKVSGDIPRYPTDIYGF